NAAADRPEPGVLALAHGRRGAGMAAADAAPVDVAFEAEHPRAAHALPVIAGCEAEHAAGHVAAGGKPVPAAMSPSAAAVDADVQAGPVVARHIGRCPVRRPR